MNEQTRLRLDAQPQPQFRVRISDGVSASGKRAYDYTVEIFVAAPADEGQAQALLGRISSLIMSQRDAIQKEMEARDPLAIGTLP